MIRQLMLCMAVACVIQPNAVWSMDNQTTFTAQKWSMESTTSTQEIVPLATAVPHRPVKKAAPAPKPIVKQSEVKKAEVKKAQVNKQLPYVVLVYITDANKCPACHSPQTIMTIDYLKKNHGAAVINIKEDKNGNWQMPTGVKALPAYAIYKGSKLVHVQSDSDMQKFEAATKQEKASTKNGPFRKFWNR